MYCPRCGTEVPEDSAFCQECGAAMAKSAQPEPLRPSRPAVGERHFGFHPAMVGVLLAAVAGVVVLIVVLAGPFGGGGGDGGGLTLEEYFQ